MAYLTKTAKGWRAQIERKGVRKSQTFATKAAASAWAAREEAAILDGDAERWPRKTLADALRRYELEVTPTKPGSVKLEKHVTGLMLGSYPELCAKLLHQITPDDLAKWRDDRLKQVKPATVQRAINMLRNVWTIAAKEWGWTPKETPWQSIRMPEPAQARDRLIGWQEARAILRRLGYVTGQKPQTKQAEVAVAFLIALRTALRASEIVGLTGDAVKNRVVTLRDHKTAASVGARHVPLTRHGNRLISTVYKPGPLFTVSAASLDALFRKARDQMMVEGLTFHDSRATALTHLARKVDVMTLARISGHKDISLLHRVYYRETAEQIAARLG